jgi:hypothetical protein
VPRLSNPRRTEDAPSSCYRYRRRRRPGTHTPRRRVPGQGLPTCAPVADCADTAPAEAALQALQALAASTASASCSLDCGEHYRTLQAYHDGCEGIERTSAAVRDGFHRFADRCERSGCNSMQRYADPNSREGCPASAGALRGGGGGGGGGGGRPPPTTLLVVALVLALLVGYGALVRHAIAARGQRTAEVVLQRPLQA